MTGITAGGNENQQLFVTARSSNPAIVPDPQVVYASPSTAATLNLQPAPDANGSVTIIVTVADRGPEIHGFTRSFVVTRVDDKTVTVDGNNPLCGRELVFTLNIVTVREPTDEEARAGGAIDAQALSTRHSCDLFE